MKIHHQVILAALAFCLIAGTSWAEPAHAGPRADRDCNVGAVGVDLNTGEVSFLAIPGIGSHTFANEQGGEGDNGVFHCKADIPLGEVTEAAEFFTGLPGLYLVLSYEQGCTAFPGTCKGSLQKIDAEASGGVPCAVDGNVTFDWVQFNHDDGQAMVRCKFGR